MSNNIEDHIYNLVKYFLKASIFIAFSFVCVLGVGCACGSSSCRCHSIRSPDVLGGDGIRVFCQCTMDSAPEPSPQATAKQP